MSILKNIEKFINEEKDLSRYKISILSSGEQKPYKARLISKEQEFINFDFSSLNISSMEEVREAVLLFKSSKEDFDKKYFPTEELDLKKISNIDLELIKNKIFFIEEKCKWILDFKIRSLNIIDDVKLRSKLSNYPKNLNSLSSIQISKVEGSLIGKYRGRLQILLYCFAKFLYKNLINIKKNIDFDNLNYLKYKEINNNLNLLFINYKDNIYKHFNLSKIELPSLLHMTNGINSHISSIHDLVNIVPDIEDFSISRLSDLSNFINSDGLLHKKKYAERIFGINTGIKRVGSESIDVLYMDIFLPSGECISDLFDRKFFNNLVYNEYIKCISTIPINNLLDIVIKKEITNDFLNFLSKDGEKFILNFEKINNSNNNKVLLSKKDSIILVPKTRSDMEHLMESENELDIIICSIRKEFEDKFSILINNDIDNFSRKKRIIKFLE
jgi:hypothetical protein